MKRRFSDAMQLLESFNISKALGKQHLPVSESSLSEELDSLLLPDSDDVPFVFAALIASIDFSGTEGRETLINDP